MGGGDNEKQACGCIKNDDREQLDSGRGTGEPIVSVKLWVIIDCVVW